MNKLKKNLLVLSLAVGIVFVWRGVWGLLDMYLLPGNLPLSYILSIVLGLLILFLHNHDLDELL